MPQYKNLIIRSRQRLGIEIQWKSLETPARTESAEIYSKSLKVITE